MNAHQFRCPRRHQLRELLDDGRTHTRTVDCHGSVPVPMTPGTTLVNPAVCDVCGAEYRTGRSKDGQIWFDVLAEGGIR